MTVISRSQWGANHGTGSPIGRVSEVIVHHTWKPHVEATATGASERATVRGIERFHAGKGWAGIGYQFLVFQSGRAYEGRGWGRSGAHTRGHNSTSVAICFVIDGDRHTPTSRAWQAARAIIAQGIARGHVASGYRVSGHTDYAAKSCPGRKTYPLIRHELSPAVVAAGGTVTPASDPEDDSMLTRGDSGPAVALFQQALIAEAKVSGRAGGDPLPKFGADGDFGAETVKAVKGYQKGAQVPVTGNIDGLTAALLVRYSEHHDAS